MLINIRTNEQHIITEWISYPLDENLPTIEVENPETIHIGFDKFIDGEIVKDDESYRNELRKVEKIEQIEELKRNLDKTDYKLFKFLEGKMTEEEYEPIKTQRQAWRDRINELESELED